MRSSNSLKGKVEIKNCLLLLSFLLLLFLLLNTLEHLLNRRDCETVAATAAADAVCAGAGVGADGDATMCGDKSFDPAAAAPFSTTNTTLQNVFFFGFPRVSLQ